LVASSALPQPGDPVLEEQHQPEEQSDGHAEEDAEAMPEAELVEPPRDDDSFAVHLDEGRLVVRDLTEESTAANDLGDQPASQAVSDQDEHELSVAAAVGSERLGSLGLSLSHG